MRLYLALAVLMLAFVAYTGVEPCMAFCEFFFFHVELTLTYPHICPLHWPAEAQDDGIDQTFARFTAQMNEMGRDIAEKANTAFQGIHESEFAKTTR